MTDKFQHWRDNLAGRRPPIDVNTPQPGFYKKRAFKNGPFQPVFIDLVEGELAAIVGKERTAADPNRIWVYCADRPVSKEHAQEAFKTGIFPGELTEKETTSKIADEASPAAGDNSKKASPLELLNDVVEQARLFATKTKITNEETANLAGNWAGRLQKAYAEAELERKALVKPLDEQRQLIQDRYVPVLGDAKTIKDTIEASARRWVDSERERLRREAEVERIRLAEEARQKAAADAAALAEKARKEAEEYAALGQAEVAQEMIAAAERIEVEQVVETQIEVKIADVKIGGQYGKRIGGTKKTTRYEVRDLNKAVAALLGMNNAELAEAVATIATKLGKAGTVIDGVEKVVS